MLVYRAANGEAEELRSVFGPAVAQVTFCAAEDGSDGEFEFAVGYDADGDVIKKLSGKSHEWETILSLLEGRDETVTFGLSVPPRVDIGPDAISLQSQVDACHRYARGFSNDDEIDALWRALELALARWPELVNRSMQ